MELSSKNIVSHHRRNKLTTIWGSSDHIFAIRTIKVIAMNKVEITGGINISKKGIISNDYDRIPSDVGNPIILTKRLKFPYCARDKR